MNMANLRNLKKEIDYRLEEVVFDCDMAICFQPSKEKEIFEVMQEAVGVRNDLFAKADESRRAAQSARSSASTSPPCAPRWTEVYRQALREAEQDQRGEEIGRCPISGIGPRAHKRSRMAAVYVRRAPTGNALLFVVAAAVAGVVLQHGVGNVPVRHELDGAVVVAQLLLGDDVRTVAVHAAVHADDLLHDAGDRADVVRHHDDRHAAVQFVQRAVKLVFEFVVHEIRRLVQDQQLRV